MKFLILLSTFILCCTSAESQITRLDISETIDSNGMKMINISDTKRFEYYHNCSFDRGFRLKTKLKNGTYEVYLNDTLNYRAHYNNRKKDSTWTYFYANGQVSSIIPYSKGFKNGAYQHFYENGIIKSKGVYSMGLRISEWVDYDQNGNVTNVYIINDGFKTNQTSYYSNGNKRKEEYFENGKYQGRNVEYYETGDIRKVLYYESDKLTRCVWYDEDGTITLDNP